MRPTPTPTATATPLVVLLTNAVTATDSEISVDDITGFPYQGTIEIDDEQMTYAGKEPTGSASGGAAAAQPGRLLNVQRGVNGTTAASHNAGAAVVLLPACVGDCDGDGEVFVYELGKGVIIALGNADLSTCPAFDADGDKNITVDELVKGVNNALNGCPAR